MRPGFCVGGVATIALSAISRAVDALLLGGSCSSPSEGRFVRGTASARTSHARYQRAAGGKPHRAARRNAGLSLDEVQKLTAGEFKTASLSAHEPGDRAVTVRRAVWLTRLYGTRIDALVKEAQGRELPGSGMTRCADVQQLRPASSGAGGPVVAQPSYCLVLRHRCDLRLGDADF